MVSSDQRSAASSASSASSRFAVSSGGSPSASRRPAGSSHRCCADRVPVLAEQDDAVLVVERDDGDRPRVVHDLPDAVPAAGHGDRVPAQRDDPALVDRARCRATRYSCGVGRHQMPTFSPSSSGTGSRAASW